MPVSAMKADAPNVDFARCYLRLANLPNFALEFLISRGYQMSNAEIIALMEAILALPVSNSTNNDLRSFRLQVEAGAIPDNESQLRHQALSSASRKQIRNQRT